jgi:6-phosphogluconolactonase
MEREFQVFKTPQEMADGVGEMLMDWIGQSRHDRFHLAISGGSTPNLLFKALATGYATSEHWQKVHFWWVDERMVGISDPESNFGTANQLLFSKISIPKTNIHRIHGEANMSEEILRYAFELKTEVPEIEGWPRFDLILLGMGEDGHTASIFPDHLELISSDHICVASNHPMTGQLRITLTGNVINRAAKICFLVSGTGKAERLSEIWSNGVKGQLLPACHIQPVAGELLWFVDKQAAHLLH